MKADIELLLFSTDTAFNRVAEDAGVDGFIVDWENRGLFDREHTAMDTTSPDTIGDLRRVADASHRPVWCRLNQYGEWTAADVEQAIDNGASHILLPMVTSVAEVSNFLDDVAGRARAGILVETVEACERAAAISALPLDMVYVGLFDLSMSRDSNSLFEPLVDGTVERLRDIFHQCRFGVGGLTTVDAGDPIPCLKLMAELVRLGADFTFLRNSFKKDIKGKDMAAEIPRIRQAWKQLSGRGADEMATQARAFRSLFVEAS